MHIRWCNFILVKGGFYAFGILLVPNMIKPGVTAKKLLWQFIMCWPKEIFITSSQDITFLASCKVDFSLKDTFSSPCNSPSLLRSFFIFFFFFLFPLKQIQESTYTKKEIISSFLLLSLGANSTEFLSLFIHCWYFWVVCLVFWSHWAACGILVSQPGIESLGSGSTES